MAVTFFLPQSVLYRDLISSLFHRSLPRPEKKSWLLRCVVTGKLFHSLLSFHASATYLCSFWKNQCHCSMCWSDKGQLSAKSDVHFIFTENKSRTSKNHVHSVWIHWQYMCVWLVWLLESYNLTQRKRWQESIVVWNHDRHSGIGENLYTLYATYE